MTDDTQAAPPPDDPETSVIDSDTVAAPEPSHAWSLDDEPDELAPARHGRIVWAGLAILVAGIVAAVILLGTTFFGWLPLKHAEPRAIPATTTATKPVAAPPVPAPAPTATVTVTPTTPAALSPEERDARFTALIAAKIPMKYTQGLPLVAEHTCEAIGQGESQQQRVSDILDNVASEGKSLTWDQATFFVTTAVQMYCPQYANR